MKSAVPRRNSLRLHPQPPRIPVPPSLKQSPYLNAPIFKRDIPSPRLPSEEDERWLQDTVPVSPVSDKASFDRCRGPIVQPSRYSASFTSEPVSPATDSTPPSPSSSLSRSQSQIAKYLAHSLAPPPQLDSRPANLLCQAEPDILRLGQPSSDPDPVYTR